MFCKTFGLKFNDFLPKYNEDQNKVVITDSTHSKLAIIGFTD